MVYIVNKNDEHELISMILDYLNIEYTYCEKTTEEVLDLIESKQYEGIFLDNNYKDYLKRNYKKTYYRLYKYINYISLEKNGEINPRNTIYEGFKEFLLDEKFDISQKTILILGSTKQAISIYNALKDISDPVVYIATITDELDIKLRPGDRKIRKIEIVNLLKADYIINATEMGNVKAINTCMLEGVNLIPTNYVFDLIPYPFKTSLLRKYELKGAKVYSGLILLIYRVLKSINCDDYSQVSKIYDYILEKEKCR